MAGVESITADDSSYAESMAATFHALFAAPGTVVKLSAPAQANEPAIEFAFDETSLIQSLRRVSYNFLTISLTIAAVVTCVLWAALWRMVLQPVRRLTSNIIAFGESPQDASRVIAPSGRGNEIGRAEAALAVMQRSLAHELAQGKRLAELGMAVARINHDLRNILSAAQLISDRLATIPDPLAQRLAPRLVATLDRAIQFCQSTLTYGASRELPPSRRRFDLSELVSQVVEAATAEHDVAIDYNIDIPPRFCVYADPDHMLRVLENLSRNAAQALMAKGATDGRPKAIRFAAIRTDGLALVEISDTGPGFPPDQHDRIFEPFHKSTSDVGAGLGLAIAADLVTRNGGAIALAPVKADDFYCGARFLIKLPTAEGRGASPRESRRTPGNCSHNPLPLRGPFPLRIARDFVARAALGLRRRPGGDAREKWPGSPIGSWSSVALGKVHMSVVTPMARTQTIAFLSSGAKEANDALERSRLSTAIARSTRLTSSLRSAATA